MVTVKELASKYGMKEKKARRILRNNGVKKPKYYWEWKEGTKRLSQVEGLLSRV